MRIAGLVQDSIVDGPGFRFTVFVQGCPHDCPGCHNPQTHDFQGGTEMTEEQVIQKMLSNPLTDGLTLSGGEPYEQAASCAVIARAAKDAGLNVWTYSGYTFEELLEKAETDSGTAELMSLADVLVDGRFVLAEKSYNVKWRGSRNQRLIDLPASLRAGTAVLRE